MLYEDAFIAALTGARKTSCARTVAIADDAKCEFVSVYMLNVTASEIGLSTELVEGFTEDGSPTVFLIAGTPESVRIAADMHRKPASDRRAHQIALGELLGYDPAGTLSFIDSGIAANCRCSSCGGVQ